MSKLKSTVAGVALLASVASTKAQQTLQRITDGANETIVELFQVRNGHSNTNVVGNGGYDQGMSDGGGTAFFYSQDTGQQYDSYDGNNITIPTYPVEQIGNGNFEIAEPQPFDTSRANDVYDWKDADGNNMTSSEFTIQQYDTDRDAIEDGNSNIDMLHTKWVLPHTLNNGDPIPDGLWVVLTSREGEKDTGGSHASQYVILKWNATNQKWEQQSQDWAGTPAPVLEGTEIETAGTHDIDGKPKSTLHPNPVQDGLYYDDGDGLKGENHDYAIYDMAGQQVGQGTLSEGKKVNINLNKGVYILKTQDGDTKKIIKK